MIDFDFAEHKLFASGPQSLIEDYGLALQSEVQLDSTVKEGFCSIQSALRLSANALTEGSTQLAGQMLGRLMSFETSEIRSLLTQAEQ